MKKYTHAFLAFMAIKRIEKAATKASAVQEDAKALAKWFKDYRDFVIVGSWYPDEVFKDNGTSHIIKYRPQVKDLREDVLFRNLPSKMEMPKKVNKSNLFGKTYFVDGGNLCDRCEAISHDIVDDLKVLHSEKKGNPICPTNNRIAMRFFILSHYIADGHMPLHCDARSFSSNEDIHAYIEKDWEDQIKKSYKIDMDNARFFYDPEGYPLKSEKGLTPLLEKVEQNVEDRKYSHTWAEGNGNTWDYMSAVTQYSYLMSYKMIPEGYDETITKAQYETLEGWTNREELSRVILMDTIDSIARVWLHVWIKYRVWIKEKRKSAKKEATKQTSAKDTK